MSSPTSPTATTKAHQFNKILNQKNASSSSRIRTIEDVEEALKKLRRLILVNGIPSDVVGDFKVECTVLRLNMYLHRMRPYGLDSGSFFFGLTSSQQIPTCDMLLEDRVMSAKRSETTHSGTETRPVSQFQALTPEQDFSYRSTVQRKGSGRHACPFARRFRVEELRYARKYYFSREKCISLSLTPLDVEDGSGSGFTYVQGMNVLAAPFLYTMPSELEAFYCFSSFIEVMCPSYVQPTLEGVHRGLKVCPTHICTP